MRVLVAMSGGVDSSVAAALLKADGHDVVGATMKLWGGTSDTGCCSVADVDDARRVAQQLGVAHHVFNFSDEFEQRVVEPYVTDHTVGRTPNPCVECNRHLKFDRFLERALSLGFDSVATGHHARVRLGDGGSWELLRGLDPDKDQSYVLHMLDQHQLPHILLPVGEMTKAEVRRRAAELGLRTAAKPDSQDVCFISRRGGREGFLRERIAFRPAKVRDREGKLIGRLPAVELLTVGQRKGLGDLGASTVQGRRYVVEVDHEEGTVTVGDLVDLLTTHIDLTGVSWVGQPASPDEQLEVQTSAHGAVVAARWHPPGSVEVLDPVRRVAAGQSVVLYRGDRVVGGGMAE